jgi:hypothetical protein
MSAIGGSATFWGPALGIRPGSHVMQATIARWFGMRYRGRSRGIPANRRRRHRLGEHAIR